MITKRCDTGVSTQQVACNAGSPTRLDLWSLGDNPEVFGFRCTFLSRLWILRRTSFIQFISRLTGSAARTQTEEFLEKTSLNLSDVGSAGIVGLLWDVGFGCSLGPGCTVIDWILWAFVLGWAWAAEKGPAQDEESSSAPAYVESSPQLPPLSVGHDGVVEVPDDGVSRPAHWDEDKNASTDEDNPCGDDHSSFATLLRDEVGALPPSDGKDDSQNGHDDSDDHEGPSGLQILRQRQQGVVDLTLHLTCALHHAVHPQALPDDLRRDDVGSDEGGHFPHGEGAHQDGPHEANDAEDKAQHLTSHWHHDESSEGDQLKQASRVSLKRWVKAAAHRLAFKVLVRGGVREAFPFWPELVYPSNQILLIISGQTRQFRWDERLSWFKPKQMPASDWICFWKVASCHSFWGRNKTQTEGGVSPEVKKTPFMGGGSCLSKAGNIFTVLFSNSSDWPLTLWLIYMWTKEAQANDWLKWAEKLYLNKRKKTLTVVEEKNWDNLFRQNSN